MKKRFIILGGVAITVTSCVINYALIDRSALRRADGLIWQGRSYISTSHQYVTPTSHSRFLALDDDGGNITGYGDDPEYTYVMRTSFLDNDLLVRGDYNIQQSGDVTAIAVRNKQIALTPERINIKLILEQTIVDHHRCTLISNNDLAEVAFSYNKSLVTDNLLGYISYSAGDWYYIPTITKAEFNRVFQGIKTTLNCYQIEAKYREIFNGIENVYRWFNDPISPHTVIVE